MQHNVHLPCLQFIPQSCAQFAVCYVLLWLDSCQFPFIIQDYEDPQFYDWPNASEATLKNMDE